MKSHDTFLLIFEDCSTWSFLDRPLPRQTFLGWCKAEDDELGGLFGTYCD